MKQEAIQFPTTGLNQTVMVNGISISYDDSGEGTVPIVFIHGFPFDRTMWEPQTAVLKNKNRVIQYDLRGFGESGSSEAEPSIDLHADDLIGFMDALNIHQCIVCGLSMGGYIALNAVRRYADRFQAVILCDTQCIADTSEAKEKRYQSIEALNAGGLNDFAESFVKKVFSTQSVESKTECVQEIKNTILHTKLETLTASLVALAQRHETCSTLHDITIPALILCGKEDSVTPVKQSEFLVASLPAAQLHILENAGHLSNLEQPEAFNEHMQSFINQVKARNHQA